MLIPHLLMIYSGKFGTINLRENRTPRIDGIPKIKAVGKSINFCFINPEDPTRLVAPTTKSDKVVAVIESKPKIYTKIGTLKILPPPPISPITRPITTAKKYPINSIKNISANLLFKSEGHSNQDYRAKIFSYLKDIIFIEFSPIFTVSPTFLPLILPNTGASSEKVMTSLFPTLKAGTEMPTNRYP